MGPLRTFTKWQCRKVRASRTPLPHEGGQAASAGGALLPDPKLRRKAGIALITEPLSFEDGQPVQLEDGSMAYIHRTPKGGVTVLTTGEKEGRQNWPWSGDSVVHPGSWGRDMEPWAPHSPGLAGTPAFPGVDHRSSCFCPSEAEHGSPWPGPGSFGSSTATKS